MRNKVSEKKANVIAEYKSQPYKVGDRVLTNKLCVVQGPDSWGRQYLITAFWAEHFAPKEPSNFRNSKESALAFTAKSNGFWATHALIPEEGEELHDIVFIDNAQ